MKKFVTVIVVVAGGFATLGIVGVACLAVVTPRMRPASTERVEVTPERVERGRYLAENVATCTHCHSERLEDRLGSPEKPGTIGQGGAPFDEGHGIPGIVAPPNLTPDRETGLGVWTDGEISRAIREGVSRDGRALFPMMPYTHYRNMSDDDVRAVVAYLRTLAPIKNQAPKSQLQFPVNFLVKFTPQPLEGSVATPDDARDHLGYGKYLTVLAGCVICHSPHDDKGRIISGLEFSGGWEIKSPTRSVITPNITPAPTTYLGIASRDNFIGRFKAHANLNAETAPPNGEGKASPMPWLNYARMTERDLGAIYDYLKTLPPIDRSSPPASSQTTVASSREQ